MSRENNVKSKDLHLINDLNAALQKEKHSGQFWVIILFFLFLVVFVVWAYNSPVEEVTRGNGNIIPSSREQVIQSLDPGIHEHGKNGYKLKRASTDTRLCDNFFQNPILLPYLR